MKKMKDKDDVNGARSHEGISFKLGELFCGPGGLAYGAKKAIFDNGQRVYKIEHAWANDYHPDSCATYRRNICPDKPESVICEDIRKLAIESLQQIDAFAYGFPCNDFSNVGERKGFNGEFGPLYTYGVKVLNIFKPKFFVAENVGGIASTHDGKAFEKILFDLRNAGNGYNLTVNFYKFEEYGIPQMRHRVIIVGIDKSLNLFFKVPKPTTPVKYVTSREALECPPISKNAFNSEITNQSQVVVDRLKFIKPGENAWTADIPKQLQLNVKGAKLSQIYRRLNPDRPSYTLTGSGGGGTHGYHWSEPRALTNRERARIQTFPDDYIFEGSKENVRKQIGMAVCPKMSQIIFESILKIFAGVEYPSVPANWKIEENLFNVMELQNTVR
jgi:DNA (cytosine-5)-methyltransferase 1